MRRSARNKRPTSETSIWKFNERFRSHNGMSLMSCNDLPVDGHASVLPLRLWRLTIVWTLLETIRHHFTPQQTANVPRTSRGESWLFLSENRSQVGGCFCIVAFPIYLISLFNSRGIYWWSCRKKSNLIGCLLWLGSCPWSWQVAHPSLLHDLDLLVTPHVII